MRKTAGQMLSTLPLLLALAALLAWGGREVQDPWGVTQGDHHYSDTEIAQWVGEMVDEQVAALGCSTTPTLTETVAVRNATGFDQGVVKRLPFDAAVTLAKAGKVFVVGWCA